MQPLLLAVFTATILLVFKVQRAVRLLVRRNPNVQNGPSFVSLPNFFIPLSLAVILVGMLGGFWLRRQIRSLLFGRKSIEKFRKYVGKFF